MSRKKAEKNGNNLVEATIKSGRKVRKQSKAVWQDFKKFIAKGNIIDLAIAVVIGTAFNKVVSSLVSSVITPLTGILVHSGDITKLKWVIEPGIEADELAGIVATPEVAVTYGLFLQNLFDFFVIALSIYAVLRIFMKAKDRLNRREHEAEQILLRAEAEKKKAAAAIEAERLESIKKEFIADVAAQADILAEIRDIMVRMEKQTKK